MGFKLDIDKIRAHGVALTPFFILGTPRKLASYEKPILKDLLKNHGYLLIGTKRHILELLKVNYKGLEFEQHIFQSGQMILFFSNLNFQDVQSLTNNFTGGRYPKPGMLATQTVMHPTGTVENTSMNAATMVILLKELGHVARLQNGKVYLPKPCIVFQQGDVLNQNQCEIARLLLQRMPEYKLRITHMWTSTGGLSILEPKRLPLMKRVRLYDDIDSTAKVCKEEKDAVCDTETGWKSIKRKDPNTLGEENIEKKIKQEPMNDFLKEEPKEGRFEIKKVKQEPMNDFLMEEPKEGRFEIKKVKQEPMNDFLMEEPKEGRFEIKKVKQEEISD